jgi:hypothetical protein
VGVVNNSLLISLLSRFFFVDLVQRSLRKKNKQPKEVKVVEFDHFRMRAGLPGFVLGPGHWVEKTEMSY